jgi:cytidine deaminase
MNQRQYRRLVDAAKRARRNAYCPYSRYPVGAAVLTESGRVFSGCNVENASYGLSLCAERNAVFGAVARGEKALKAVCVVGRSPKPCGACRQVMAEFSSRDTELLCLDVGSDGRSDAVTRTKVFKMLPNAFDPLDAGLLPPNPQNLLRQRKPGRRRSAAKKRRNR